MWGFLSKGVSVQGGLCPGISVQGGSLSRGDLCPGGISVQRGSLSRGDLCPGGISVQGSLSRGSLSRVGVSVGGSLSRGVSVGGSLSRGSLSREVSVWGSLSRGLYPGGSLCPGGLCQGGISVQGVSVQGSLSRGSLLGGLFPEECLSRGFSLLGRSPWQRLPYGNERVVRTLLECILVFIKTNLLCKIQCRYYVNESVHMDGTIVKNKSRSHDIKKSQSQSYGVNSPLTVKPF